MAQFKQLVLVSLGIGLALAGGCRSPNAHAATTTQTTVRLSDWQTGTDLTNFQHPHPNQYLAVPNVIATANQQASTHAPHQTRPRALSILPQTDEAHQFLAWLGLVIAGLTGWLVWLKQRRRE
ncbi:LPXTG cell wall anchor domain-containing protein [Lactiplantibacillus pentosus]|uniref:LPXTG cell wall anchor domain-containing protein n=1 Tax=Lactiplantibacillus pentosus TaxID=1589 RepID=UPI003C135C76